MRMTPKTNARWARTRPRNFWSLPGKSQRASIGSWPPAKRITLSFALGRSSWTSELRENCSALDVGSGCLALVQALAVAQSILGAGRGEKVLVVTSDVHSRTLGPGRAKGEFGGLFGDGASAFLLTSGPAKPSGWAYRLGEFFFGCAAKYAQAIRVSDSGGGGQLDVQFDGEALSRAAVSRMEKILREAERRSGISRADVSVCNPPAESAVGGAFGKAIRRARLHLSFDCRHARQPRSFYVRRGAPRSAGRSIGATGGGTKSGFSGVVGTWASLRWRLASFREFLNISVAEYLSGRNG